jgi:outer membrane protein assembly factor BamB
MLIAVLAGFVGVRGFLEMSRMRIRLFCLVAWLAGSGFKLGESVSAGDWPQILGPHRNGVAEQETLAEGWTKGGPKKVWEAAVGSGYSGVAVVGRTVVVFHRLDDEETVTALAVDSGEKLWSRGYPTTYRPQIEDSNGPRCVPVVADDKVITFGVQGVLSAWELKTGKPLWSRKTHAEFSPPDAYFGAGSTPLVDGKRVLVNVGGRNGAGIVAFDLQTGKTLWQQTDDAASYSSPIAVTIGETRHALFLTRLHFVSLDPGTGRERFRTAFGQRGPTVNAANPVLIGEDVLLTASYGIGAKFLRVGKDSAQIHWEGDDILASQYTTPIVDNGLVYGVDGRQDGGPVSLKCFDPETRKVYWTKPLTEYATLIAADGKLLIQQTDGTLRMAKLTKEGYAELAHASLAKSQARPLPALAQGRYYLRDRSTLRCYDLR